MPTAPDHIFLNSRHNYSFLEPSSCVLMQDKKNLWISISISQYLRPSNICCRRCSPPLPFPSGFRFLNSWGPPQYIFENFIAVNTKEIPFRTVAHYKYYIMFWKRFFLGYDRRNNYNITLITIKTQAITIRATITHSNHHKLVWKQIYFALLTIFHHQGISIIRYIFTVEQYHKFP